jgi:hypothetical protein
MTDDDPSQKNARYPLSRLSAKHELVDVAAEIAKADATVSHVAVAKLRIIAEQIRMLQAQAAEVLDDARRTAELHRARCSFQRRPGQVYHLYRAADGERYWSILSPTEWGTPPDAFEGSFRLEADASWTPLADVESREEIERPLRGLLGAPGELTDD